MTTRRRRGKMSPRPEDSGSSGGNIELGQGAEFDMIRQLLSRWGPVARGIGSDCAVLDLPPGSRLVVSTDSSVEGVHFRRDWLAPREIGYRAAASAWSDLAAAAASPLGLLFAVTVPTNWWGSLGDLADGVGESAAAAGAPLIGGDVTAGPALVLTLTVMGTAAHPLSRVGARPGSCIYLTGVLGGPLAALRAWDQGQKPDAASRARFARPTPRLVEAQWLAARGAVAAIDVSDGLVADLGHLAAASGVQLAVDLARFPRWPGQSEVEAASSGEEYELVVAADAELDTLAFERQFNLPLTYIGEAIDGPPGVDVRVEGTRVDPLPGYDHLSSNY